MAVLDAQRHHENLVSELIARIEAYNPGVDKELIRRAFEYLGKQKQVQKAKEALEVYAPLAHRLGIHTLKWELEDLSFQVLHPRKFSEITAMVADRRADREAQVDKAAGMLRGELEKAD